MRNYLLYASQHQVKPDSNFDLRYIRRICEPMGKGLKGKGERHTIIIRTTILPGTMRKIVIPRPEEFSSQKPRARLRCLPQAEFLREGTTAKDFRCPPAAVMGEIDKAGGNAVGCSM